MKRFLLSTLTLMTTTALLTTTVSARQVGLNNPIADLNGDGNVTLHEVVTFNRDRRDKN